jgi:hypothetical protein
MESNMKNNNLIDDTIFKRNKNAFAIFQSDRYIQKHVMVIGNINKIDERDYYLVYTREIFDNIKNIDLFLENIFVEFNLHHPEDYIGRSLSISDVVVIKQNGIISTYICNEFGFRKIENFINEEQSNMKKNNTWIFSKEKNKFVKFIPIDVYGMREIIEAEENLSSINQKIDGSPIIRQIPFKIINNKKEVNTPSRKEWNQFIYDTRVLDTFDKGKGANYYIARTDVYNILQCILCSIIYKNYNDIFDCYTKDALLYTRFEFAMQRLKGMLPQSEIITVLNRIEEFVNKYFSDSM